MSYVAHTFTEQLSLNEETAEESTIQAELANIEGRRMNISEIYERWKEGRSQVGEACRQFSIALSKWRSLSHSDRWATLTFKSILCTHTHLTRHVASTFLVECDDDDDGTSK